MKLWLDDVRKPPEMPTVYCGFCMMTDALKGAANCAECAQMQRQVDWVWCKSVEDAVRALRIESFDAWALDHDLGGALAHYGAGPYDHAAPTGYDFIVQGIQYGKVPNRVSIHSTNMDGVMQMVKLLYQWSAVSGQDMEIIVRPMAGKLMDRTPYYDPAFAAK